MCVCVRACVSVCVCVCVRAVFLGPTLRKHYSIGVELLFYIQLCKQSLQLQFLQAVELQLYFL